MRARLSHLTLIGVFASQGVVVTSARAAQSASTLVGKVTDRSTGQGVSDVQVVVTSNSLQGEQSVLTDASGSYRIPNLPAGTYTVQFFHGSYKPYTNTQAVVLRTNQTIRYNAPLQPQGMEEMQVLVEVPSVDVGSSSSGSNLDREFISKVPIAAPAAAPTKSFEAVAVATPGAKADQFGTSIAGTTSPENGYKIDGVSVGNPAFGTNGSGISLEFLSEVQVISGGYMPEYGRSTGGTISATTRSGSNELHGSVWIGVSPGALEGKRNEIKSNTSSIVTERELSYIGDLGFVVDGPIMQDKLWFAAGVQLSQQRYKLERSIWAKTFDKNGKAISDKSGLEVRKQLDGSGQEYQTLATQLQAFGKLTYAINPDHRIRMTAFYNPSWSGDNNYLQGDIAVNNVNLNGQVDTFAKKITGSATDVALHWLGSADNKRWTFDTSVALHRETRLDLPRDGTRIGQSSKLMDAPNISWGFDEALNLADLEKGVPQKACAPLPNGELPCDARQYLTGGPGYVDERRMNRIQLRHTTGRSFWAAGHHTVKAGVDIEYLTYGHKKAHTGGVRLRDRRGNNSGFAEFRRYGVLIGPDKAVTIPYYNNFTTMQVFGGFLQDSWSIMDKVTLNAGLRYDAIFINGSDGQRFLSLPKQFAPRIGLIWDPTQKGKSKIFAQYARYYQGMSLDIADRSASLESGASTAHLADSCVGLLKKPTDTKGCLASEDPERLYGNEKGASLSYGANGSSKTAVDPNLRAQSSDELSFGAEYNVIPRGKIGVFYQKRWLNSIIEDVSRDESQTYFIANPCEGIAKDFPCAKRSFDAVQLVLSKSYSDHWLAQASYQWSHTRGNISGLFQPESGQLDPNINSDFDLMSLLPNRMGDLAADRRHEIKVFGGGDYPINQRFSLEGGLAFDARSGAPSNYLGSHDLYGTGQSFLLVRGSGPRLPWQFNINANLGARFHVGKTGKIQAGIQVFNLANFQAVSAVDQVFATDSRLKPITDPAKNTSEKALQDYLAQEAQKLAAELNEKSGAAMGSPDFVTPEEAAKRIKNPNHGNATAYQAPRSFRFTLRYDF